MSFSFSVRNLKKDCAYEWENESRRVQDSQMIGKKIREYPLI